MKIATLNYSGSVGKTIAASHLLAPRMPGASIYSVESTNESAADLGLEADQLRGEQFGRLFRELLVLDDAIVDVGASNIEDFLDQIIKHQGAQAELDLYVLPVTPSGKAQRETIKTIRALAAIGVNPNRIRVLFNRVQEDVRSEFEPIFGFALQSGQFVANEHAAIFDNEVFDLLAAKRTTISDVLADDTDYRTLIRQADKTDTEHLAHLTEMHVLQSLARPVNRQLDHVFAAIINGANHG